MAKYESFIKVFRQFRNTRYYVSKTGDVKNKETGRILKPSENTKGYLYVFLSSIIKQTHFFVSRLVAEVWIPNPEQLKEVDHIDHNIKNNNVENLRWASRQTQNIHRRKINTGDNTTEVIGVSYYKQKKAYVASIRINGNKKRKAYSICKYGKEEALKLASKWRSQQELINSDYQVAYNI